MAKENPEVFREMMREAFNISELKGLTFDKFPELHIELHDRYDLSELTIKIFDHAKKKGLLNLIIDFTKAQNPIQYEAFASKLFFDDKSFNSRDDLEDQFIDVDFESYDPEYYPQPENLNDILQILEKYNLIVLHSNANINWFQLLSHLAWQLNKKQSAAYRVKQLFSEARLDKTPLIRLLRSTSQIEPTIFLSSIIRPEDVSYTLKNLQVLSKEKGHLILIQTELNRQVWESRTDIKSSWFLSFRSRDLHPLGQRSEILANELEIDFKVNKTKLRELAKYLDSYQDIKEFFWDPNFSKETVLSYFSSDDYFRRLTTILEKRISKSDIEIKRSLFNQLNGLPMQVLAIGMAFLNHVNKKDLIPFLDAIVFNPWRQRIPNLNAFDLGDLDKLQAFYDIRTSREVNQEQIITDYKAIFKIAWKTHRHFFLSAGYVLYDMLKLNQFESVDSDFLNALNHTNLSNEGLELIKISIQKYLTYLNYYEPNLIMGALINFASSEFHELRISAARIISELQEIDEASDQEKIYRIYDGLNIFQQEKRRNTNVLDSVNQNLDTTSVLVIAFAAKYNLLNQLDNKLAEMFIDFIRQVTIDQHPENIFRKTLRDEVVPIIVSLHHGKFDTESPIIEGGTELLEVAAVDDHFRYKVCEGLASAYLINPPLIESKLNGWRYGMMNWRDVEFDFLKNLQMSLYLGTTARIAFNFFYEKDWYLIDASEEKEWQAIRLKYKKLASYFGLSLKSEKPIFLLRHSLLKEMQYLYLIFMTYEGNFFDSVEGKLDESEWRYISEINSSNNSSWYGVLCLSTISRYLIQRANFETGTTPVKVLIDSYPNFPDFLPLKLEIKRFGAYEFVNGRQINFYVETAGEEGIENFCITGIELELIHNIKRKESSSVFPNIAFVLQILLEIVHLIDFPMQKEIDKGKDRRQYNHQFILDFAKINSLVRMKSNDVDRVNLLVIRLMYSVYEIRRNFSTNFDLDFHLSLALYIAHLKAEYRDEFEHLMSKLLSAMPDEPEDLFQRVQSANEYPIEYEFGLVLKMLDKCFDFTKDWGFTINICVIFISPILLAWLILLFLR